MTDEFLYENPDFTAFVGDGSHHSLADYAEALTPTSELISALPVEQPDVRKTSLLPHTSLSLQPGSAFATLSSLDLNEPLDLKLAQPGISLSSQLFPKVYFVGFYVNLHSTSSLSTIISQTTLSLFIRSCYPYLPIPLGSSFSVSYPLYL